MGASENNAAMVRDYLTWQDEVQGRRGVTLYNYASALSHFLDHLGDKPLSSVTPGDMEDFIARPRGGRAHGQPGSPSTRAKEVTILRGMFGYLVNRGHLKRNPAALLGLPRVTKKQPKPIPDADWQALWASELELPERVAYGLGFFFGLRAREICELAPDQVMVLGERLVNFTRKGGGDDVFPYGDVLKVFENELPHLGSAVLLEPLHAYVEKRRGHPYLLQWGEEYALSPRTRRHHQLPEGMTDPHAINRHMKVACAQAGLDHYYTPHQLRHSFVTNLLRAGVPLHIVQTLANHSSPAITMGYAKVGGSELREWMKKVNRHS